MAKTIVAFDAGSAFLKTAIFSGERNRLQLTDFDVSPVASPAEAPLEERNHLLARQMKSILSLKKVKSERIFVSISGQSAFTRFVKLPSVEETKISQIIRYEAQQQVPFPIEDVEWDHSIIGKTPTGEIDIVLVAAKNDVINSLVEECSKAGLNVAVVDVAPLCVYNCLRYVEQEYAECTAVLDFGAKAANFIISEGDDLWARTIPIGGDSITAAIAKELNLDDEDAEKLKQTAWVPKTSAGEPEGATDQQRRASQVAGGFIERMYAELARSIGFYRSQAGHSAIRRILLSGGSARLKNFGQFLADRFKVDVGWLSPLTKVAAAGDVDRALLNQTRHLLAGVVGLGLRANDMGRLQINLLPKSIALRKEFSRKKRLLIAAGWLLVASFLIMAAGKKVAHGDNPPAFNRAVKSLRGAAPGIFSSGDTLKEQKEELESIYDREITKKGQIDTIKADIEKIGEKVDAIAQIQQARLHWIEFIEDLKRTKADAAGAGRRNYIWLTGLRITSSEIVASEYDESLRAMWEGTYGTPSMYRSPSSTSRSTRSRGTDTRPWVIMTGYVKIPPEAAGEMSGSQATDRVERFMNALDRMGERFECARGHRYRPDEMTGVLYPVSVDTGPATAYRFYWDEKKSEVVLEGLVPSNPVGAEVTPAETEEAMETEPSATEAEPGTAGEETAAESTEATEETPAVEPSPEEPPDTAAVAETGTEADEEEGPSGEWKELARHKTRNKPDWLEEGRIVGEEISICPIELAVSDKAIPCTRTFGYLDEVYISEVEPPLPGERVARFKILARFDEQFEYAKKSEML